MEQGRPVQRVKALVHNSKAWKAYVENALVEMYRLGLFRALPHPGPDERVKIECLWYVRNDRTDCVNFHDLLADTLKKGLEIDDRWFLIQDLWSEVDQDDPHVYLTVSLAKQR